MKLRLKFISTELLSLISAFALLTLAGFVTLRADEFRRDTGASLRHTIMVESSLHRLYGAIRTIESDERGFLITRDTSYLHKNKDAIDLIVKDLNIVSALVSADSEQRRQLENLRPILAERLKLLAEKRELIEKNNFDQAINIIRSGSEKSLMDQIDKIVWNMISDEERAYRQRDFSYRTAVEQLQNAVAFMILAVVVVMLFAIWLAQRQMVALQASSQSLKIAYNSLLKETEKREKIEAQLRQSQKLEAIGQLTGGIAHDFNNMLGVIVASLNILKRKLGNKEEENISLIESALTYADNASDLIRRLLAFSRIQPLAPALIDINIFIEKIKTMIKHSVGPDILVQTDFEDNIWIIKIDENELQNTILNIVNNARDAMPEGGILSIKTKNKYIDESDNTLLVDLMPGDYVQISIGDTGKGISSEEMSKVFDPFFTTKPVGKGSGLGLSQVHGFVKQSGGHVRITSKENCGAVIDIFIPRVRSDS